MKVSDRVKELFSKNVGKRPEIPVEFGRNSNIHEVEAELVKKRYKSGAVEELISLELGIDLKSVDMILSGEIWPYSGTRLKRPNPVGPNPLNCYTNQQRKFAYGVIGLAKEFLSEEEFKIFCNMSGLPLWRGNAIHRNLELVQDAGRYKRARKRIAVSEKTNTT